MRMIDDCRYHLVKAGFTMPDADALRRISMTLHRWHELECGDGNDYGSWCITRGRKTTARVVAEGNALAVRQTTFEHDDDGKPYLEHHHYLHGRGKDTVSYSPMPDRERGALKRLAKIMEQYPQFASYIQGDPRGASLYILDRSTTPQPYDANYSHGIAVYK